MKTYSVESYDDVVPDDLRWRVWEYIQKQPFHATRKDVSYPTPGHIIHYTPSENKLEYMDDSIPSVNNQYMHRCVFGNSEKDLDFRHKVILELWNTINKALGDKYEIAGDKEGMADPFWKQSRCYVNAQPSETIKRSHGIHRDTIDLNEEKNFTLLYIANLHWYPTWMAENVFYSDDVETGDTQEWQRGYGQCRGFNVGWPFAIVSPVAGRIIKYDGRTLHTTKPCAPWAEQMRYAVVFRIRQKD